jgi:hypothetical protein
MSNSTKRAIRTLLHVLVAVAAAVPAVVANLPAWEVLGQVVAVAGVVSKVHNSLETSGLVPEWLKGDDVPAVVQEGLDRAPQVAADVTKVVADVKGDAAP